MTFLVFMWEIKYHFVLSFLQGQGANGGAPWVNSWGDFHVGPTCLLGRHVAHRGPHVPFPNETSNCSNSLIWARIDESFTPLRSGRRNIQLEPSSREIWTLWFLSFCQPSLSCVCLWSHLDHSSPLRRLFSSKIIKNNLQLMCTMSALQVSWKGTLPSPSPFFFKALHGEPTPASPTNL